MWGKSCQELGWTHINFLLANKDWPDCKDCELTTLIFFSSNSFQERSVSQSPLCLLILFAQEPSQGQIQPWQCTLGVNQPCGVQEEQWMPARLESLRHPLSMGRARLEGQHNKNRLHLAGYFPSITALAFPDPIVKNSYLFCHYTLAKIYCTKSAPTIIIVQKTFAVARLVLLFIRHSYYILAPNKAIQFWHPGRQQVLWIKPGPKDVPFTFLWLSLIA